jgi:hypothetical protein
LTEPSWEEENSKYLAASLDRLRLLLERLAEESTQNAIMPLMGEKNIEVSAANEAVDVDEEVMASRTTTHETSKKNSFIRRFLPLMISAAVADSSAIQNADSHGPPETNPDRFHRLAELEEIISAAEGRETPPALVNLSRKFGLSNFERDLLFLCVAMELDTKIPNLCARAQDDLSRPYPNYALAMALFDGAAWDALSPERPLRYWKLIEIDRIIGQPTISSPLRADEKIISYIKAINYLDDRLASILIGVRDLASKVALPASQRAIVDEIHEGLKANPQHLPIIELLGEDSSTKQMIARTASNELGLYLYRFQVQMLPNNANDLELLSRLWQRESILMPIALYADASAVAAGGQSGDSAIYLNLFLESSNGIFFLDVKEKWGGLTKDLIPIKISKPTPSEQRSTWLSVLRSGAGDAHARLSSQFDLNLPSIEQITRTAISRSTKEESNIGKELWRACREETRPQVAGLAQILDPKATWSDIVLPPRQMILLHQISDQMGVRSRVYDDWGFRERMNRGMGISVLFVGESGTGKTMAAEVLANDLELDLCRVDLSAVVSKYIGETEKNLKKVFDSMEGSGAILFFDEADALFGKRSEVKDSHDRYANIEVNYLLQRMEAYRGLAILATNMKSALDKAFTRRLRFVLTFPFPGLAERRAIWERAFPEKVPTTDLDYDRLARLNLTGGSIYNIVLNAAFQAAKADSPVNMSIILESARNEFQKQEMPINEADFIWPPEAKR